MPKLYNRLFNVLSQSPFDSASYQIASKMLENFNILVDLSLSQIAEITFSSKSNISKFIRSIGYEDFADFKYALQHQDNENNSFSKNVIPFIEKKGLDSYFLQVQSDLMATYKSLDVKNLKRLCQDLYRYDTCAAFGTLFSQSGASDLQSKLAYYHKFLFSDVNMVKQEQFIAQADANTLILLFSDSGNYIHFDKDFRAGKNPFETCQAKIVMITSNKKMKDHPKIDYIISYEKGSKLCTHRFVFSLISDLMAYYYQKMLQEKKS